MAESKFVADHSPSERLAVWQQTSARELFYMALVSSIHTLKLLTLHDDDFTSWTSHVLRVPDLSDWTNYEAVRFYNAMWRFVQALAGSRIVTSVPPNQETLMELSMMCKTGQRLAVQCVVLCMVNDDSAGVAAMYEDIAHVLMLRVEPTRLYPSADAYRAYKTFLCEVVQVLVYRSQHPPSSEVAAEPPETESEYGESEGDVPELVDLQ